MSTAAGRPPRHSGAPIMTSRPPRTPADKPAAYDRALGWLARREHSRSELRTKLARGGHAADEAAAALEALEAGALQSDARFAGALARSRAGQGYGPRRIVAELRSHGIADAAVRDALAEVDVDWLASARRQLQRQYGRTPARSAQERARRAAFLLRRGFDGPTVGALTRADAGSDDDSFD
ncbi:Regulatory protein RecX [Dokdonella koreensis DS-123]|uniref:Regulatory protein RecX n=2 Tax=Dokdonella TaxID=323413 RepID=A0A160DVD2_9GAMM|nr:Regulatory protein RecX [Dokdonella koreensis DS-123]